MKFIRFWLVLAGLVFVGCNAITIEQPVVTENDGLQQQVLQQAATAVVQPRAVQAAIATPVVEAVVTDASAVEQLLINVYQRVSPAVVHIEVTGGRNARFGGTGTGSGLVLNKDGDIVTNNHVVEDAGRIRVIFSDGTRVDAQLVGADSTIDLAVIRVDVSPEVLVPVELGNSDTLRVGQRAIAIGNPFRFDQSMTVGIISALGRVVDPESDELIPGLIQTDAAINPGNSGGPLLDSQGRVIGINTLIFSRTGSFSGVGFAIPVNTLRRSLPALLDGRQVGQPWLGIAGPPEMDDTTVSELNLPSNVGAYVNYVFPDSPAAEAGIIGASEAADGALQPGGDLIVAVDGVPVESFDGFLSYLATHTRVGQTVKLTLLRGKETLVILATLGERPGSQ